MILKATLSTPGFLPSQKLSEDGACLSCSGDVTLSFHGCVFAPLIFFFCLSFPAGGSVHIALSCQSTLHDRKITWGKCNLQLSSGQQY